MRKSYKFKIQIQYIISLAIIFCSFLLTALCRDIAYQERGYQALGGEYLVFLLGLVAAVYVQVYAYKIKIVKRKYKHRFNKKLSDTEKYNSVA